MDGLVLPGVGSFTSAQRILDENREAILEDMANGNTAVLGICLGMQLLFERSTEGKGKGLGVFEGDVIRFVSSRGVKVPHMGWNTMIVPDKESELCDKLSSPEWVYFVHSFYPIPKDKSIVKAWTEYGRGRFASVVEQNKVFGTQFHPEKSHSAGAKVLSNYVRAVKAISRK